MLVLGIFSGLFLVVRSFNRDDENDYSETSTAYSESTQPEPYVNDDVDSDNDADEITDNNLTYEPDETDDPYDNEISDIDDELREPVEFCGLSNPDNAAVISDEQAMSYLALINNCFRLSREFSPSDLSPVDVESMHTPSGVHELRETAARAAEQLFQAAEAEGMFLIATSGYRSYDLQNFFHTNAVRDFGLEEARRRSAVPGHSEHQLGLALDLSTHALGGDLVQVFTETPEGGWVNQNAHRFGFILSFPYGREEDTGIMYEPWHIRYVGVNAATEIFNGGLVLEEFLWYNYQE